MSLSDGCRFLLPVFIALTSCDAAYPEVVVVNKVSKSVQLRNMSFNGCIWDTVIGFEEATSPARCLPGSDRVHFQKQDVASYCREQAEDGTIDGVCPCDAGAADRETDTELINETPFWFNYQTVTVHRVEYGSTYRFEIIASDLEQDFSVPGPYGH